MVAPLFVNKPGAQRLFVAEVAKTSDEARHRWPFGPNCCQFGYQDRPEAPGLVAEVAKTSDEARHRRPFGPNCCQFGYSIFPNAALNALAIMRPGSSVLNLTYTGADRSANRPRGVAFIPCTLT